jgi:Zn finger protein HypA/HybF involved in hydrogenase expression
MKKAMEITVIFPIFACPYCSKKTQLEFDPRASINVQKWAHFKCPFCHRERITIEDGRVFCN